MLEFLKKFHIPAFFKAKKFIFLGSLLFFIFLFTPISLHQVGQKIENFIDSQAIAGVKKFEKQTGLQIEWESLEFNIFLMTVTLENVQVLYLKESSQKKIEELRFLDGRQKIKTISARPSMYSFLFKKEIILSELKIDSGDISLKTIKKFKTSVDNSKNIKLPIKKIFIKNTNINLKHKAYSLKFSDIKSKIIQTSRREFDFSLRVQSFYFNKNTAFEGFFNIQPGQMDENKVYQLIMEGAIRKNQVFFSQLALKNNFFSSQTQSLKIAFNSKGLTRLELISSGSLPVSLIQEGLSLANREIPFLGSNLSYDLDVQYTKNRGYRGSFSLLSKDLIFRSEKLKTLNLKGQFNNKFLFISKGFISTESRGSLYIKSIEWGILEETTPFNISVRAEQLSLDFITDTLLNISYSSVQANLTGDISCQGMGESFVYVNCQFEGKSRQIKLRPKKQTDLFSFHGMDLKAFFKWENQQFTFEVNGEKNQSSSVRLKGKYSHLSDDFSANYSFFGNLDTDLQFYTPFPLKGSVRLSNGKVSIQNSQVQMSGQLSATHLNVDSYQLKNVSSFYKFENNQLSFINIEGRPGKTNYSSDIVIDFNKEELKARLDSNFFDIQDFLKTVEKKVTLPVNLKGSGSLSFFVLFSWGQSFQREFHLKGDFFNILVGQDFFSQSTFDISFKNKAGIIRSLLFRKGQGLIEGSGSFDENYELNMAVNGQNLPLESIDFLNEALPLNQSGDISFNLDIKGPVNNPNITGSALLSNTFLYSYPVKDSSLKFKINKRFFSFSGKIIDKIQIDQFSYPFSKKSNFKIKGHFYNFDFIKVLLSKNKKDKIQNYSSKLKGSFDIEQINKSFWKGLMTVDDIFISKSEKWIKSKTPFSVLLNQDKWSLISSINFVDYNNENIFIKKIQKEQLLLSGSTSLSFFSVIAPFFEEFDGDIKGRVFLNNNLKQLKPKGSLQIEKALLTIPPLPSFINVSAKLVFSNNNIIINDFNSKAGGGSVKGIGTVFYDFVRSPMLDLNLSFDKVYFQIPEGFNTRGSGKIKIKGSAPPYLISGGYNIESGSIVREFSSSQNNKKYDFSLLEEKDIKQRSIFKLNLNLKTQQAVSINSSLIRSSIEGQANIYGSFNSLLVKGKFTLPKNLKQSLIFFRGQEFKISSGSILFRDSSPENPYLDISADTVFKEQVIEPLESQEKIEKQYKIFLSVKGHSQKLKFSLKSAPVLTEREIISLLTLGINARRFDTDVKQNITDYSYQILASFLIEKPLNKEIKDTLGLDFRLTPYIDTLNKPVTKITLSKSWFEKWRASFSRTLEESAHSDVRLKYDLNNKISLTAFWENRGQIEFKEIDEDFLGLDLEFNFDF